MSTKKPAIRTSLAPRKTDARDDLIPQGPARTAKPAAVKDPITKAPARKITVQLNSRVELDVADLVDEAVASGQFSTKQAAIEHAIRTTFGA